MEGKFYLGAGAAGLNSLSEKPPRTYCPGGGVGGSSDAAEML